MTGHYGGWEWLDVHGAMFADGLGLSIWRVLTVGGGLYLIAAAIDWATNRLLDALDAAEKDPPVHR